MLTTAAPRFGLVNGTGVFSFATNGAVDPETGFVEILDFAVAEDCGTMVNPMIVEGQIRGGAGSNSCGKGSIHPGL